MSLSLGIVGLPNVGKSTLFNAITNNSIPAENYPFCTIDPNVGIVKVFDKRFDDIVAIVNPDKVTPAVIEFHDIAGIVKGAHKGEGLGNAFLTNIRSTNAIVHVIRSFSDSRVTHVNNLVNPLSDKETIEAELILKDLDSIQMKKQKMEKEVRKDKSLQKFYDFLDKIESFLGEGKLLNELPLEEHDLDLNSFRHELFLLTDKPVIYLVNGDWIQIDIELASELRKELKIDSKYPILPINIAQEFELSRLNADEKKEMMDDLGIEFSGLEELTKKTSKPLPIR